MYKIQWPTVHISNPTPEIAEHILTGNVNEARVLIWHLKQFYNQMYRKNKIIKLE
jgi:hypothetical protein